MTPAPPQIPPWVVIDASVWVSRLVAEDSNHRASKQWLDRYVTGGGRLAAPVLLLLEVAGAVARRTGQPALAHRAVQSLEVFAGQRIVALDTQLGSRATHLAADLRLRGADAAYVALAAALAIPLVTWDAEQQVCAVPLVVTYTPATAPT